MEYTRLGNTGLQVSKICLGGMSFGDANLGGMHQGWILDEEGTRRIIKKALSIGINFFDTANIYGYGTSEEYVGIRPAYHAKRSLIKWKPACGV